MLPISIVAMQSTDQEIFKGTSMIETIEVNPQYADAYINRGTGREMQNDLKSACQDWRKAAELGKKEPAEWVKEAC